MTTYAPPPARQASPAPPSTGAPLAEERAPRLPRLSISLSPATTVLVGSLTLLLVAAAGWMLLLGPLTSRVAEQREAAVTAADRTFVLTTQLSKLRAKAEDLTATVAAEEQLRALLPPTADQPGFFEQVGAVAREAGYAPSEITTLSPTAPQLVAPPAPPPAEPDPAAEADGSTDAAAEATPAPAPPAEYAAQTVSLSLTGSYDEARRLLAGLESLDRAFLLRSISIAGEAGSSTLTVTLSGSTFVAPPLVAPDEASDVTS